MMKTVVLSGRAYAAATQAGWPQDNPRGFTALCGGEWRRIGKGRQWRGEMRSDDATDLGWYLLSVAEVWECMTADERGSDDPRPVRKAAEFLLSEVLA